MKKINFTGQILSVDKEETMVEGQGPPERSMRKSSVILNDNIAVDITEGDIRHGDDNTSVGGETLNKFLHAQEVKVITDINIDGSNLSSSSSDLETAEKPTDQDESQRRDLNEVDWDGPDDPECPMNWPRWRKSWIIIILSVLRLLMWAISSLYDNLLLSVCMFAGTQTLTRWHLVPLPHQ